jgi:hypothetical protein
VKIHKEGEGAAGQEQEKECFAPVALRRCSPICRTCQDSILDIRLQCWEKKLSPHAHNTNLVSMEDSKM